MADLSATQLGEKSEYISVYTPSLLCPIPRQQTRESLGLSEGDGLPFTGVDIWMGYELSWLDLKGKPQVAVAEFRVPCNSPAIIESKSFKLYLNSLNQTRFSHIAEVASTLESDLSVAAGAPVSADLTPLAAASLSTVYTVASLPAENIDHLDIEVSRYTPDAALLELSEDSKMVSETLSSDLLKSNCPVTGQPDWATIYIRYRGEAIKRESLLRYIISYREHQDFHEHCVEQIFLHIQGRCCPQELTVYARYTRRGGLDINPFRTNCDEAPFNLRVVRQ